MFLNTGSCLSRPISISVKRFTRVNRPRKVAVGLSRRTATWVCPVTILERSCSRVLLPFRRKRPNTAWRTRRHLPLSTSTGVRMQSERLLSRTITSLCWLAYVTMVLCSDVLPGASVFHIDLQTLQEAVALSLNFWFILPILRPEQAPVLHPVLESSFQVVVSWALLFFGFLSDDWGRHWHRKGWQLGRQQLPMWAFLLGSAMLTNVFYLPYLVVRQPLTSLDMPANPASPQAQHLEQQQPKQNWATPSDTPGWLLVVAESRLLPLLLSTVVLIAFFWAFGGRPSYPAAPPYSMDRLTTYINDWVLQDRLAVSFSIDMLVFAGFQAVLVPDDMRRRGVDPQSSQGKRWLTLARWIPFFGVAWYLWKRPRLLGWPKPSSSAPHSR